MGTCTHTVRESELGRRGINKKNKLGGVRRLEIQALTFSCDSRVASNEPGLEANNADTLRATPAAVCAR